jgi:hypothetical protein
MEYSKSKKSNSKILNKINYAKTLLIFFVSFILFGLVLYYVGNNQDLNNSIGTSLVIALLLSFGSILGDIYDNRDRIIVFDKKDLGYIEIHKEKNGGAFLKELEYDRAVNKYGVEDIYINNDLYDGIDKGIIKEVLSLKKEYNRIVVKANVIEKQWNSSGFLTISKLHIVEKEYVKKIIIPNDYDNYEKIYKLLYKLKKGCEG